MVHLTANIGAFFIILIGRIMWSGAIVAACAFGVIIVAGGCAFAVRAIIRGARRGT